MVIYNGEKSTFNEGAGQMDRINRIQDEINLIRKFPLMEMEGRYMYQITFENINSLLAEVSSKLSEEEKENALSEMDKMRILISQPVKKYIRWESLSKPNGFKRYIDYKVLEEILDELFKYLLLIRKLLEEHDMTSPKAKDPTKAIYGN